MISVVIPTFNRADRLTAAIDSIVKQTFQQWELIVVDDGSIDHTAEVAASFGDPRIRYFRERHGGVSRARNAGIRLARYSWVAFLDSDDLWFPCKLQRQIEALQADDRFQAVYTDEVWIRRGRRVNPRKKHQKFSGWIFRHCLPLCIVSPSSIVLRRRILDQIGLFDELFPVCEDYELWLRLAAVAPILYLDEPLITKVGGHPDQLSRSTWGLDRFRVRALLKTAVSKRLTWQQYVWVGAEIARKSVILASGYQNRGKLRESTRYRELALSWSLFVRTATSNLPRAS